MRLLPALLLCLALPAHAETLSQEIGRTGLASTEARLAALPARSDAESFVLGGVQFLRAIEGTFQDRWAVGLTDRTGMLPLLRLPLGENPSPDPFQPAAITALFTTAEARLSAAQATLTAIPATSDFSVEIALDDIWFDVNDNGTREPGEGIGAVLGATLAGDPSPSTTLPTVRFDVADAAWAAAYAHLLAGFCDLVRAYDPTEPLTRVLSARAAIEAIGPITPDPFMGGTGGGPDVIDLLAAIVATLDQQPSPDHMAAAHGHFLSMIARNRDFWTRVAVEADNDREWLPNDAQQAALGIQVPQGTGAVWLSVLDDLEAVLTGDKLVPYWRAGAPAGVNVARVFSDPRPIDLLGWFQGWAALPYLEQGPLLDTAALEAFDQLTSGQAPLFALYLN